jgi:hypothetical protein
LKINFPLKKVFIASILSLIILAIFLALILGGYIGSKNIRTTLATQIVDTAFWVKNKTFPPSQSNNSNKNSTTLLNAKTHDFKMKIMAKLILSGVLGKENLKLVVAKSKEDQELFSWLINQGIYFQIIGKFELSDQELEKLQFGDLLSVLDKQFYSLSSNPELTKKILDKLIANESENGLAMSIVAINNLISGKLYDKDLTSDLLQKALNQQFSYEKPYRLDLSEKVAEAFGTDVKNADFMSTSNFLPVHYGLNINLSQYLYDRANKSTEIGSENLTNIVKISNRLTNQNVENNLHSVSLTMNNSYYALKRLIEDFPHDPQLDSLIEETTNHYNQVIKDVDAYALVDSLSEIYYKLPDSDLVKFKEIAESSNVNYALKWLTANRSDFINTLETFEYDPYIYSDIKRNLDEIDKLKKLNLERAKTAINN